MILWTFLLFSSAIASNLIHIQYFRKPEEYGRFLVSLNNGTSKWKSEIYMNRAVNLREEEIYKLIKPFFEGDPSERRYESASITRHLGKQFEYILNRYPIDRLIFENLCSQMKPKFSLIIGATNQKPKYIKWVVEHPTAAFTIPDAFQKEMGREEYTLEIGGRALLSTENFEFDALKNTQNLTIKQTTEYKNGFNSETLVQLKGSTVLVEGSNIIKTEDLMKFAKQWVDGERKVKQWIVDLEDPDQQGRWYFERAHETLDISIQNKKLKIKVYETPKRRPYQFTHL
uniref:F-box associated domain-containing protein n=1 Tax=Caenorhabditis japonica TaxID=281687 RepID=A0A8R1DM34_CAEJA